MVRVLILDPLSSIRVTIPSGFFIGEEGGEAVLRRFESGGEYAVRHAGERVVLQGGGTTIHEAPVITIRGTGEGNMLSNP